MWVEAWSPEYGASYEIAGPAPASEEEVAPFVETASWAPLHPEAHSLPPVAFVDGVSRVDARAFLDPKVVPRPPSVREWLFAAEACRCGRRRRSSYGAL